MVGTFKIYGLAPNKLLYTVAFRNGVSTKVGFVNSG